MVSGCRLGAHSHRGSVAVWGRWLVSLPHEPVVMRSSSAFEVLGTGRCLKGFLSVYPLGAKPLSLTLVLSSLFVAEESTVCGSTSTGCAALACGPGS